MANESEDRKLPYGSDQLGYYVGQDDQYDPEDIEEPVVVEVFISDAAICTGCAAHMPCVGGFHRNIAGDDVMMCESDNYALEVEGANFTEDLRKRYAGKSAERDRDQADRAVNSCLEAYPVNDPSDVEAELAEVRSELKSGNSLHAKLTDYCRDIEAERDNARRDLTRAKSIIKKLVHPDGEKNFVGLWADENKENERLRKEIVKLNQRIESTTAERGLLNLQVTALNDCGVKDWDKIQNFTEDLSYTETKLRDLRISARHIWEAAAVVDILHAPGKVLILLKLIADAHREEE